MIPPEVSKPRTLADRLLQRRDKEPSPLVRQLEAERARLVAAQAVANVGSWETDLSTFEVTWSQQTHRIFETSPILFQPTHAGFLEIVHPDDRAAVAAAFVRSAARPGSYTISHRLLMPDGRIKFIEERWETIPDEQDRPVRAIGTCQDVTERHLAEQAIRMQAHMLDNIGQAVIATDLAGQITYANRFAGELYGWAPAEMLGRSVMDVTVPETSVGQGAEIMERLQQGHNWSGEFLVRRRDGTAFPAFVVDSPLLDAEGTLTGIIGISTDISERKQAAAALDELSRRTKRREQVLTTTLSSLSDFAYIFDRNGRFLFANQPLLDLWGIPLEKAVGKNFFDLDYPAALAEKLQRQVQQVFATKASVTDEIPFTGAAGRDGVYEYILSPAFGADGEVDFVVGATRDITERKRSEEALRASLAEFRTLSEALPQIVWIARPDGWNLFFNQRWMDYTGLTLEESLGHGWNQTFHPDDLEQAWEAWEHATATMGTCSIECRLRRADGAYRWWLLRGVPLQDADGNVLKYFGTSTDIHELKLAQEDLKQALATQQGAEQRLLASEEEYRPLFDGNPHAMWVFDSETLAFLAVNDAAVALYGFSRDEFLGMTIKEIRPPEEVPALLAYLPTMPETRGLPATQVKHRKKDGSHLEVEAATSPIQFHGRRARLVLAKDVSEKRLLESQLLQAQKMEAVGRLAGGVAHDFNNALGVILGYTELLLRQGDAQQKGKLEQIRKATESATGLTRQLLAFSRKQVVDPKVLDLNLLLSDVKTMLGRLIGEDIDLAIVPGAALGQVKADAGQVEQVVMNLCVNARDAMPDGGLLRIETSNVHLDAGHPARHESMAPGRYVMLAVSDSGCGMDKEVLAQIFEPFFTTKGVGKGTGLGLAMVYGTVKQAGGHVGVYSEVGQGTTFKVYLPRIDEPVTARIVDEAPMPDRGTETILVVEDEAALRAIALEILSEHGYRVLAAAGAEEAIAIAHGHPERIDLVVTDVVMPGTNGRVLANALTAARPGIKVLYMSGYTDDVIAHRGVLEAGTRLLEKPFTVLALLRQVRAALQEMP